MASKPEYSADEICRLAELGYELGCSASFRVPVVQRGDAMGHAVEVLVYRVWLRPAALLLEKRRESLVGALEAAV